MPTVRKPKRWAPWALAAAMTIAGAVPAPGQSRCGAAKKRCVGRTAKALVACHGTATRQGVPVDAACVATAFAKFDAAATGCFPKAEARPPCRTPGDVGVVRAMITNLVARVVARLDPGYPAPVDNDCAAAKERCVGKVAAALLRCHARADGQGVPVDPVCVQAALAKLAAPATGCFAKAEAKPPCLTTGDVGPVTSVVGAFVDTIVAEGAGCPPNPLAPGDYVRTLAHGGLARTYRLHVPPAYQASAPTPLVVGLHGGTQPAANFLAQTGLPAKSDGAGFLLVAPEGSGGFFGIPTWNAGNCCGGAQLQGIDDVGFIAAMLNALAGEVCLDWRRLYVTGLSNGAMMAHRLGCELSDRVAAIAPDAGGIGDVDLTQMPPAAVYACSPVRPVPVFHMHGSADTCYPFAGGVGTGPSGTTYVSIPDTIAGWVSRNGCAPTTTITYQNGSATCETNQGCAAGADVTLCLVTGLGHVWPGQTTYLLAPTCGGAATTDLIANDATWDFFVAHPFP